MHFSGLSGLILSQSCFIMEKLTDNLLFQSGTFNGHFYIAVVIYALKESLSTDLVPLCDIDCVHRAGADGAGLILEKQHAGQELWVLVISIQDVDGDDGAGIEMLSCGHFLR